ncbi:hypothetical protein [Rugamonas sp. DEMB1]|uniref:hypothetical protein n=1 Tax=Rugamonas sp. DEMB1 TaxID=3039386 RepID=UPI00244815D8|nr:hypothetical protein [Rugamonas sp. DEMB1]WGG52957.1 hypothetical protein QC826_12985 [Rugamonas sp. DEMB1]
MALKRRQLSLWLLAVKAVISLSTCSLKLPAMGNRAEPTGGAAQPGDGAQDGAAHIHRVVDFLYTGDYGGRVGSTLPGVWS